MPSTLLEAAAGTGEPVSQAFADGSEGREINPGARERKAVAGAVGRRGGRGCGLAVAAPSRE